MEEIIIHNNLLKPFIPFLMISIHQPIQTFQFSIIQNI